MPEAPFYAQGLRFSCRRCSGCCRHESGYVFLSEKDLGLLAAKLSMKTNEFMAAYCRWVYSGPGGEVLSLKEKSNYDCIFWKEGCSVYDARPLQCRTFPFWQSNVASSESWNRAAAFCPGMGTGTVHTGGQIESCLAGERENHIMRKTGNGRYGA
ncbi:zinc/iron-chelating domain-containing protein [Spirochaetia bacterium]|nr:zinc/iron-chelating domain-containing protein [Spirochaetia bacterium]